MMADLISRQAAIEAIKTWGLIDGLSEGQAIEILADEEKLPSAQPEPAIPLQWIEAQIEWLKSLDNAFSALTAGQISAMVNKWKDEQDEIN
jgi:uncharacterized protein YoaH (UPF0181 family)